MTNEESKKYLECAIGDGSMEFVMQPIKTEVLKNAVCALGRLNSIFEDIDNLTWYHVNKHGEVVEGSSSDYETFYKAKDIFGVLAKYGYEDYDG